MAEPNEQANAIFYSRWFGGGEGGCCEKLEEYLDIPIRLGITHFMSLCYYFEFTAPASTAPEELELFLREVEKLAASLGFGPTTVLNVPFDTPQRREFSRRLGGGITAAGEPLKGSVQLSEASACRHDPVRGSCMLVPERGIVLVVTDEQGCETCFGFLKFASAISDINGKPIMSTDVSGCYASRNCVNTPDARIREIVQAFAKAGYLEREHDEYSTALIPR